MPRIEVHVVYRSGDDPPGWEFGVYDLDEDMGDWQRGGLSRAEALNYAQRVAQTLAIAHMQTVAVHIDRPDEGVRLNGPGTEKTLEVTVYHNGEIRGKSRVQRVKLRRVVEETVHVLVEVPEGQSITGTHQVILDKLETHADNFESWDGDHVARTAIAQVDQVHEDVQGKPVFRLDDPKHLRWSYDCCGMEQYVYPTPHEGTGKLTVTQQITCMTCGKLHQVEDRL